jgi:hypothetical protein
MAASVTITNPGFEADIASLQGGTSWSDAVPAGWSDPQGGDNTNFMELIAGFAGDGQVHLGFDGNELGLIYQDLGTVWAPNTQYTLTVGAGNRTGFGAGTGRFSLISSNEALPAAGPIGNGPYVLFAPTTGFSSDLDTATVSTVGNAFADATFQWVTGAVAPAGNLRLTVQSTGAVRLHLDNVRLDATVIPEPASAGLGLLISAFLFGRRRRP